MRHHAHRVFWIGLLVYAGALAVCSLIIAVFWGGQPAVAALFASTAALGVVALCAEPWRHLKVMRQRQTKRLNLVDDLNIERPPGDFERFEASEGLYLVPGEGLLGIKGERISGGAWSRLKIETPEDEGGVFVLTLSGEAEERSIKARVHPAKQSAFYWACWRLCLRNQWELVTPLGSFSHKASEMPLIERIQLRLGWLEGHKGDIDLDDLHGPVKTGEGPVPLCVSDHRDKVAYRFPDGSAPAAMDDGLSAAEHEHKLRRLTLACLLGVVTAPLAVLVHTLRVRPPGLNDGRSLTLGRDVIKIDQHAESLDALEAVTAFPVHKGPPLILTRRNAVFVGGLDNYEKRIAWGRHLLERSASLAGDERYSHRDRILESFAPSEPKPHSSAMSWIGSFTIVRTLLSAASLVFAGAMLNSLIEYWSPFWTFFHAGIGLDIIYGELPWWRSLYIVGALAFTVLILNKRKGTPRWPLILQGFATMPLAAVLAFATQPSVNPLDYDKLAFDPGDHKLHFSDWGHMAGFNGNMAGVDLRHFDFSSYPLGAVDMSSSTLSRVNLSSSNLTRATLIEVDADQANFEGAMMKQAVMARGRFAGANFDKANLDHVDADGALLTNTSFRDASMLGASFKGATLSSANLSGADMRDTDLRKSFLIKANLSGADLTGANLSGALMEGADLRGANLSHAYLTHTRASVRGAILSPETICPDMTPAGDDLSCD